jgi:hypothetical protein
MITNENSHYWLKFSCSSDGYIPRTQVTARVPPAGQAHTAPRVIEHATGPAVPHFVSVARIGGGRQPLVEIKLEHQA